MKESSKSFQNIFLTAFVLFLLAILFLKGISILAAGNVAYQYLRTYKSNGINLSKVLYTQLLLIILWTAYSLTS